MVDPATKSTPAAQSGLQLLIQWANGEDGWVRQLASLVLSSPDGVSPAGLDAVFTQYLREKRLLDGDAESVGKLGFDKPATTSVAPFTINSISHVTGVNALAPDQEIEFNDRLTILFGENGSGKTGYTRILKTAGAVRTVEPILPNIHSSTAAQESPHARLEYTSDGQREPLDWNGEEGLVPFTYISIFDSASVAVHVDDELSYTYTPGDLAFFPLVTDAINSIRERLEDAMEKRKSDRSPYLANFTKGTSVYALMETLGAATNQSEIEALATLNESDAKALETLDAQVAALGGQAVSAQIEVARARRDLNQNLMEAARVIDTFDATAFNKAITTAKQADGEYVTLRKKLLAAAGLGSKIEEEWQAFILKGEDYRRHLSDHDEHPRDGDPCIYCQQPLSPDAATLLRSYQEFANDASRQRARDSRELATTLARNVTALNRPGIAQMIAQAREGDESDKALADAAQLVDLLETQLAVIAANEKVNWQELGPLAKTVAQQSEARVEAAEKLLASLSEKEDKRAESLQKAIAGRDELRDRFELKRRLSSVSDYVRDARWVQQATELTKRFSQLLRSLTETAKQASEELINSDFADRFKAECDALRAPPVTLDFPGREGRAARRKTLLARHRPSEVLSEGEQKVIALADFLAEADLRQTPAPLVFDDPVSSLDYRRISEVADRIADLAQSHQVIVLTHSIWFATELLARFEKDQEDCSYFGVSDDASGKGLVVKGTHPRWDTVKKTRGKINEIIASAKDSEGEAREALIERAYSFIRTWCEVAVESDLLAGVTTRYEPHVGMTKLRQIRPDRLSAAIEAILPVFEKACRVTEGHSQPLETLAVRPTLDDLTADWDTIQEALKKYKEAS